MQLHRKLTWPSRGFLSGVALCAPFAANPYPTTLAAILLLPLIIDLFVRRIRLAPFFKPTLLQLVIVVLAACHVAALLLGTTPYSGDVLRNLIWSGGVVGIVLLASDPADQPQDIIRGLFTAAAVTAVPIAVAGLVKYGLQLNGVLFGSLINTCFGRYPQGTTFCGDYNLFSLYIGIAALGASALILRHQSRYKAILLVCLAIILAAGLFAGSRRFAAIAVLVAIYWAAHAFRSPARTARLAIVPLALTALLYAYYGAPRAKIADEEVVTVEQVVAGWFAHAESASRTAEAEIAEPASPLAEAPIAEPASPIELLESREPPKGTFGPVSTDENGHPRVLAARDVSPVALASTFQDNYGFGSRVEKWNLGWQMIQENGYIWGRGFAYHQQFSCRFVNCEFIDYPHSSIMSAWIAFGVLGLFLALSFYGLTGIYTLQSGIKGLLSGSSFVALAVMPYSLISGDTIFSLPHAVIAALLVGLSAKPPGRLA